MKKCNSKNSYQFLKKFLKSEFLNEFEIDTTGSLTYNIINQFIEDGTTQMNYLLRYPKPILTYLVEKEILTKSIVRKNINLFEKFKVYYSHKYPQQRFPPLSKREINGYFNVSVSAYSKDYRALINEIRNNFHGKTFDIENEIFIKIQFFNDFVDKYKNCDEIHWTCLSSQNLGWNNSIISSLKDKLNWKELLENPSVLWDFSLLRSNKDKVDWERIIHKNQLVWESEQINEFKNYLHFSNKSQRFRGTFENYFGILHKPKFTYNHSSISLSENVNWDINLIREFEYLLDWDELSLNESIRWRNDSIKLFQQKINFKFLSYNKNVEWTYDLILTYKDLWDWDILSGNPSLPWSYEFLIKFETKWKWKDEYNWLSSDYSNNIPAISNNTGITWNNAMIERWQKKINLWQVCLSGKLTDEVLYKHKKKIDVTVKTGKDHFRNSDSWETVILRRSGWENISKNENISVTPESVIFLYNNYTETDIPDKNLDRYDSFLVEKSRILEVLRSQKVIGFNLSQIINNEPGWAKVFVNENFVNESIWEEHFYPFFTKKNIELYLGFLNEIISCKK